MNKYYVYSLLLLLMAIFSFMYAVTERQLAGYAFSFSFFCYVITNLSKGLKLNRLRAGVIKSEKSDSSFRIFIVKLALSQMYTVSKFTFSKTREYKANFYNEENYVIRKKRNSNLDIVCSKTKITIYDYSPDIREHPLLKHEYDSLSSFLKDCISNHIRVNVRPGVQAMYEQIKQDGKIDPMATAEAIEEGRPKIEELIETRHSYIDSSKYLAVLSKFVVKSN